MAASRLQRQQPDRSGLFLTLNHSSPRFSAIVHGSLIRLGRKGYQGRSPWLVSRRPDRSKGACSCGTIAARMKLIVGDKGVALQGTGMSDTHPSVLIIDDDPEFRDSVGRLLR